MVFCVQCTEEQLVLVLYTNRGMMNLYGAAGPVVVPGFHALQRSNLKGPLWMPPPKVQSECVTRIFHLHHGTASVQHALRVHLERVVHHRHDCVLAPRVCFRE